MPTVSPGVLENAPRYDGAVPDEQPLSQQLEELGAQLDWVREYL
jgi:hypothetical protein